MVRHGVQGGARRGAHGGRRTRRGAYGGEATQRGAQGARRTGLGYGMGCVARGTLRDALYVTQACGTGRAGRGGTQGSGTERGA